MCKVLYSIIVKRRNFHFTLAYVVPGTGRDRIIMKVLFILIISMFL